MISTIFREPLIATIAIATTEEKVLILILPTTLVPNSGIKMDWNDNLPFTTEVVSETGTYNDSFVK
jgi:hypothetical protein